MFPRKRIGSSGELGRLQGIQEMIAGGGDSVTIFLTVPGPGFPCWGGGGGWGAVHPRSHF